MNYSTRLLQLGYEMYWDQQKTCIIKIFCKNMVMMQKKSWSIIKNVINKNKRPQVQTWFKLPNGNETTNSTLISEKFNDSFYKHWSHTF